MRSELDVFKALEVLACYLGTSQVAGADEPSHAITGMPLGNSVTIAEVPSLTYSMPLKAVSTGSLGPASESPASVF